MRIDRRTSTGSFAVIRVLVLLVLATRVAAADQPEAERLYAEGQAAYDAKNYDAAIGPWTRSYELSKLPALLFNLAQAHRLAGHCTQAVDAYQKFIAADPTADDKPAAEQFIKELSPCPAGKPIRQGPIGVIDDHGRGKRTVGIATMIGGGALVATGLFFGSRARSLGNDVKDACAMGCEFSDIADKDSAGRRDEKLQYVLVGAGVVALATGAVLYVMGRHARTGHLIEGRVTGRSAAIGWRF